MSRLTLEQILLHNLQGRVSRQNRRVFMEKEAAHAKLCRVTGQDFGHDAKAWRAWIKQHPIDWAPEY